MWRKLIPQVGQTLHRFPVVFRATFGTKMAVQQHNLKVKDFSVPVSYGHIAGKSWGDEAGSPVLALHGWQDNAGTFDRLIPLLSPSLHVVAIDAPGHGLSSHKPHGTFYHYMEMLVDIQRVVKHLKWTKFSIVGHSLGGTLAVLFASVYPEAVSNMVLLDIVKPASRNPENIPQSTKLAIESLLELETKFFNPAPVYTYAEARSRLMDGIFDDITGEAADILLKRGSRQTDLGTGVVFTRDIRLKMAENLQRFSHEMLKAYMAKVKCNLLIIMGKDSKLNQVMDPAFIEGFIDIYKKNCNSFKLLEVEGNHFVHLNQPENVAPFINEFFEIHSKL